MGLGWATFTIFAAFVLGVGVGVAWPMIGLLKLMGMEEPEPEQAPVFSGHDRRRGARGAAGSLDQLDEWE